VLSSCESFYWAPLMRERRFLRRASKCGGWLRTYWRRIWSEKPTSSSVVFVRRTTHCW